MSHEVELYFPLGNLKWNYLIIYFNEKKEKMVKYI